MNLREYDAGRDHAAAAAILRSLHARGPVPYTIHPGDWAWWTEHRDPRFRVVNLIGPGALVEVGVDHRYVAAFGLDAKECVELGEHLIGDRLFAVSDVSAADVERHAVLADLGFVPDETMSPLFARENRGGVVGAMLPEGFTIRPLAADEGVARAAAARRAFASTMDPTEHTDRYLRFMQSPQYALDRDMVAVAPDGRIAAFTIFWLDELLSLALFEPIGTDPDFQRRGLARALIAAALERLDEIAIRRARVQTNGTNTNAIACYQACGFEPVDRIGWWRRRAV